jgi:phage/plasmid-associated DNA primase
VYLHEISKEVLTEWGVEKLGKVTKLFLDYDCDVIGKSMDWIRAEKKAIRDLLIEHSVHYANGFVFTETHQPDKISFHIIFKRIAILRSEFHPELEKELFSKILGPERFKDVDESVYHNKLWFRLPYGILSDKPYQHIPYYPNDLSDYIVSLPDDTQTKSYEHHPYLINKQFEQLMNEYRYAHENDEEHDLTARQERMVECLELLKKERFVAHNEWFKLMCLCRGNNIPQHIFLEISEASGYKKFNRESCIKQWDSLVPKKTFGFPLLHKWLEEDGINWKELFPSLSPIVRAVKNLEINDFGCTDKGLASVLYQFYKGNLYFTSSHGWIHWKNTRWEIGSDEDIFYPICELMSKDLQVYIKAQLTKKESHLSKLLEMDMEKKDAHAFNIANSKLIVTQTKEAYNRYRHIQSVTCMKNVLKMAKSVFKDDHILETFDMKPHLFSFNDQSIDIRTGEVVPITKEQRILTTCGYNLPERVEDDVIVVKSLLTSIMGENVDSFIRNLSVTLYGGNNNECFQVWTGIGRNGKGVVDHMTKRVMGKYYNSLPITELTEDSKGQGRTSSEIANCRWARMVVSTEPEKGAVLKVGKIKQLTGKDEIVARQLYQEAFSFLPKFNLFLQCNEIPRFSKLDDAIQKRILITDFPFQFVTHPEREYQRLIDTSIKDKISQNDSYRNGLLWLLLESYKQHNGHIIRSVANESQLDDVILDNSPLKEFLADYEPSQSFIRFKDLFDSYHANYEPMKKGQFKNHLLELKIKTEEDKIHGMKIFLKRI